MPRSKQHRDQRRLIRTGVVKPRLWAPTCSTRRCVLTVCAFVIGIVPAIAYPQELNTLGLTIGGTSTYDSNLFRVSGELVEPQSETSSTAYARLNFDKEISRQRVSLGVTGTAWRYDRFSNLNFDGLDYSATLAGALATRLTGSITATRTQAPVSFADRLGFSRAIRTTEDFGINLDARIARGWYATADANQSTLETEGLLLLAQPDFRFVRYGLGVRYVSDVDNTVSLTRRWLEGDQESTSLNGGIVESTDDFQEDNLELAVSWVPTINSNLTGTVTYLDRQYNLAPQRDFSGYSGSFDYRWQATSKLSVSVSAIRTIEAWQSLTSNYRVSNSFVLSSPWQMTEKTALNLRLRRTYDDFPAATVGAPEREDISDTALLGLNWAATRNVGVEVSVSRESRDSNNPLFIYDADIVSIAASISF